MASAAPKTKTTLDIVVPETFEPALTVEKNELGKSKPLLEKNVPIPVVSMGMARNCPVGVGATVPLRAASDS